MRSIQLNEIHMKIVAYDFDDELDPKNTFVACKWNSDENSLTSYDGRKFKFKKNISSIEITNECLNLISGMTMGSNEYSEFLKTQK